MWHDATKEYPEPMKDVLAIKEYDFYEQHFKNYVVTFYKGSGKWCVPAKWHDKITWWTELPEMPE